MMNTMLLNADMMTSESGAMKYLWKQFGFEEIESEEKTPDLLFANLMSVSDRLEIEIDDPMEVADNLGRFGLGLIKIFEEAAYENELVDLVMA